MYKELYQYLVLNRQVNLPGVGVFQLERKPADVDFVGKIINPPTYTIALHHSSDQIPAKQISWLADELNVSEIDISERISRFAKHIKDEIVSGKKFEWNGVGVLSKGLAGEIRFESALKDSPVGKPVAASKVLREKAEHTVRVGEDEKTAEEMIEFLNPAEKKRSYEWIMTLIVIVLAIIFLAWHFMQTGLNTPTGSQQKVSPKQEEATYKTEGQ